LGGFGLLLRFDIGADGPAMLYGWLATQMLPTLPAHPGLASSFLFRSGLQAAATVEQSIRGQDAGLDWALLVTGFARPAVDALASGALRPSELERRGASGVESATYQLLHCLSDRDLAGI
jgi:hypothetical protein